jgi:cardiolipin synthase
LRLANSVGAAISNRRVLGTSESGPLLWAGLALLAASAIGFVWPRAIAWPLAGLAVWIGVSLIVRYCGTKMRRKQTSDAPPASPAKSAPASDN